MKRLPCMVSFFDVEEQYQQEMESYLAQDTDVAYTSILTMKATVSGVKNVVLLIGGVIGAVFALVGLINFINLVMTNIITRRLRVCHHAEYRYDEPAAPKDDDF